MHKYFCGNKLPEAKLQTEKQGKKLKHLERLKEKALYISVEIFIHLELMKLRGQTSNCHNMLSKVPLLKLAPIKNLLIHSTTACDHAMPVLIQQI